MVKLTTKNLAIGAVVLVGAYLAYNKIKAMQAQKEAKVLSVEQTSAKPARPAEGSFGKK
jgi:hypothetical protein